MKHKYHWPLIGHSNIKEYLQKQIENEIIPHALLFSGPDQIGKFSLSKLFAKSILCDSSDKIPCEICSNCKQIENNISSDLVIINKEIGKQNISIKQIRELQQKLSLKSFSTKHKIIIINNAHYLSEEASNALLKTLEEPYPNTVFIIVTNKLEHVPQTIKSRCQILKFNTLPTFQIENWLIAKNNDKRNAKIISNVSLGKPGVALNYISNNHLFEQQKEQIKLLINLIKTKSISERLSLSSEYLSKSITNNEILDLLNNWEQLIRDIIIIKNSKNISNINFISAIKKISTVINKQFYLKYYQIIKESKYLINKSINPKLVLENLIIQL